MCKESIDKNVLLRKIDRICEDISEAKETIGEAEGVLEIAEARLREIKEMLMG